MINIIDDDSPESLEIFCLNLFNPMGDVELGDINSSESMTCMTSL